MGIGVEEAEGDVAGRAAHAGAALGPPFAQGVAGRAFPQVGIGAQLDKLAVLDQDGGVHEFYELFFPELRGGWVP